MRGAVVMVVDDSLTVCRAIERTLTPRGVRVDAFSSGGDALQRLRWAQPDLLLCDIMLPDIKGFEICRFVKAGAASSGVPVVFISGVVDDAVQEEARQAGAVGILRKPFTGNELVSVVDQVLSRYRRQPALTPTPQAPRGPELLERVGRIQGFNYGFLLDGEGVSRGVGVGLDRMSASALERVRELVRLGRSLAGEVEEGEARRVLVETSRAILVIQPLGEGGTLMASVDTAALGQVRHVLRRVGQR